MNGRPRRIDVIATDLDRTLTDSRLRPVPAALRQLRAMRAAGAFLVLVTGRTMPELRGGRRFLSRFDAAVLEGGAVIGDADTLAPVRKRSLASVVRWLQQEGVPHVAGLASVSMAWRDRKVLVRAPQRDRLCLARNRERLDVTWRGVDKGTGLQRILRSSGFSARHVLAFGDGENDIAMFRRVAWGVAVANAAPALKKCAAETAEGYGGFGVARFLSQRKRTSRPRKAGRLGGSRRRARRV